MTLRKSSGKTIKRPNKVNQYAWRVGFSFTATKPKTNPMVAAK